MEATSSDTHRQLIVGKWLGEMPAVDGSVLLWLATFRLDGTFETTFRRYRADESGVESAEFGDWGYAGSVLFTITRGWVQAGRREAIGERKPIHDDAYEVIAIGYDELVYRAMRTGDVFRALRVSDDYELSAGFTALRGARDTRKSPGSEMPPKGGARSEEKPQ